MIRLLTPTDAEAFIALRLEAFARAPLSFDHQPDEEINLEDTRSWLGRSPEEQFMLGYFLPGDQGDELMGMWGLVRHTRLKRSHRAAIISVYVSERARGKGAARQLMNECIARAKAMPGLERLILTVSHRAEHAVKLYASAGFTVFGREPGAARDGTTNMDEIYMMLDLGSVPD